MPRLLQARRGHRARRAALAAARGRRREGHSRRRRRRRARAARSLGRRRARLRRCPGRLVAGRTRSTSRSIQISSAVRLEEEEFNPRPKKSTAPSGDPAAAPLLASMAHRGRGRTPRGRLLVRLVVWGACSRVGRSQQYLAERGAARVIAVGSGWLARARSPNPSRRPARAEPNPMDAPSTTTHPPAAATTPSARTSATQTTLPG